MDNQYNLCAVHFLHDSRSESIYPDQPTLVFGLGSFNFPNICALTGADALFMRKQVPFPGIQACGPNAAAGCENLIWH